MCIFLFDREGYSSLCVWILFYIFFVLFSIRSDLLCFVVLSCLDCKFEIE